VAVAAFFVLLMFLFSHLLPAHAAERTLDWDRHYKRQYTYRAGRGCPYRLKYCTQQGARRGIECLANRGDLVFCAAGRELLVSRSFSVACLPLDENNKRDHRHFQLD
jgi:hypothetical protein